jgi:hypothetical protein
MESHPNWNEWKAKRGNGKTLIESKGQRPNYSFDNWLKMTKALGDEVSSFVGQAKEKDQELDDEIKKKKLEPKDIDDDDDDDDAGNSEDSKDKETAWKKIRDIAKERRLESEKSASKSSSKPVSKSSRSS